MLATQFHVPQADGRYACPQTEILRKGDNYCPYCGIAIKPRADKPIPERIDFEALMWEAQHGLDT